MVLEQPALLLSDWNLIRIMLLTLAACGAWPLAMSLVNTMVQQQVTFDQPTAIAALRAVQQERAWGVAAKLLGAAAAAAEGPGWAGGEQGGGGSRGVGGQPDLESVRGVIMGCVADGAWGNIREILKVRNEQQ